MKSSLSMILPVRNAQAAASSLVAQALEVLPELTSRWDLLIVDDGSTDATSEIVEELTRSYPQVTMLRHSGPHGEAACFRAGARRTRGEILLLRSADCDLELAGLHKMWKRIATADLVVARAAGAIAAQRPTALASRRAPVGRALALQMVRRRVIEPWMAGSDEELQQYLARSGFSQHEVDLRRAAPASNLPPRLAVVGSAAISALPQPQHCDGGEPGSHPRRPNYLTRLKAFALGE